MKTLFFSLAIISSCFAKSPYENLESLIETIPDFPKPGINFKWYPQLLKNPKAFHEVIMIFKERYKDQKIDALCGLDSRGFVFGAALAYELKIPFIMIRKAGKLPKIHERIDYALEYGTASFEIECDALNPNDKVVIIDDILATGGTALAAATLVERLKAQVLEIAFLIELKGLNGRSHLKYPIFSILSLDAQ